MRKELEVLLDCPVCNFKYEPDSVKVVDGRQNVLLVHVTCGNCKTSSLALVSKNTSGMTAVTMGMLTDLDYEEAGWMLEQAPITADEVLDIHQAVDISKSL